MPTTATARRERRHCGDGCRRAAWEIAHRPARDEGTVAFRTADGDEIRFTPLKPGELQPVSLDELEPADARDLEAAE